MGGARERARTDNTKNTLGLSVWFNYSQGEKRPPLAQPLARGVRAWSLGCPQVLVAGSFIAGFLQPPANGEARRQCAGRGEGGEAYLPAHRPGAVM